MKEKGIDLGIIADDLTGSLDTGVQFSKWGLSSLVGLRNELLPDVACAIMNTDSRAVNPDTASDRVRCVARLLQGRLVYKKIDSTLRGNVGIEVLAAMQELKAEKAIVAPAFPDNGRTVVGGRLFVYGAPLDQTGFARDPRNAINESHIPTLLQRQLGQPVGSVDLDTVERGSEAIQAAISHFSQHVIVVDAENQRHLTDIAKAVISAEGKWLPVGSAGLAGVLPAVLGFSKTDLVSQHHHAVGPVLIVAGSRNEVTAGQLRKLRDDLNLPVIEPDLNRLLNPVENSNEAACASEMAGVYLVKGQSPIITTSFAAHIEKQSLDIAVALGKLTVRIMRTYPVGSLFLTGGDIALQVGLALEAHAFQPIAEVLPGLPISILVGGEWAGLPVITKAGGFGDEKAMVTGFHYLENRSENER